MATLRNRRKLAAVSKQTQEITSNSQLQHTFVPRVFEEKITQVSEEAEDRITEEMSQDFSRTESLILGVLSNLDEFLLNPQVRTFSRTVPGVSRDNDLENREPTGDLSKNYPYPEVEFSTRRSSNSIDSDQEEISHTCLEHWILLFIHRNCN